MPHATFDKRYIHSATGTEIFHQLCADGHIIEWHGVYLDGGAWIGVIVPAGWQSASLLEKLTGVTLLPSPHSPRPLSHSHLSVVSHAGAQPGDTMWDVAEKLHAHHGYTHGTEAAKVFDPNHT